MNPQPVIDTAMKNSNPSSARLVRLRGVILPNSGFVTRTTRMAWVMWALSVILFIGYIVLRVAVRKVMLASNILVPLQPVEQMELSVFHFVGDIILHMGYLAFSTFGVLIVLRHPENRIGSIFCVIGLLQAISEFATYYAIYGLVVPHGSPPGGMAAAWLQSWIIFVNTGLILIFFPLLFPDGHLLSLRWRSVGWLGAVMIGILALIIAFYPGPLANNSLAALSVTLKSMNNPLGIKALGNLQSVQWILIAPFLTSVFASAASLFIRFRSAASDERQQIKWFAYSAGILAAVYIAGFPAKMVFIHTGIPTFYVAWRIAMAAIVFICVPLTTGIAILKYRLYEIDFLINRTLVYSLLTAFSVGIYIIVVGVLGTAIQGRSNLLISVLATGLVAVLVQSLRDWLQRVINRLMYGERDDPVTVLSRLGRRLETTLAPDTILPVLTETIAQTLKLPYVAIHWESDRDIHCAVSYGQLVDDLIEFPFSHHGATIGQLIVAPRSPAEALSPMDRHLLKNIAHQAGMAVHGVSLTADLQRSRRRLVTTREEERRRLRRDLHDGLGPNLASQGLKLAAIQQLLEKKDSVSAISLLDQVMTQNQSTVEEIRHLVYGLRPPALDELGLVAAIRDYVAGMGGKAFLQIMIKEPDAGLPPLSAAVEVAAYRIVLEALTNVIHHAQANRCLIQFSLVEKDSRYILQIKIQDDGIGLPSTHHVGVGTRSMRERAEEVGGTCVIESPTGGGTRVCVAIPLVASLSNPISKG